MSTPWKDAEDAFWQFLADDDALGADATFLALHQYRSHQGRGLPFADSQAAFKDPTLTPALWLRLVGIDSDISTPRATLCMFDFEGGLAYALPSDATSRDTFEGVVEAIRGAILRRMTADAEGISVHALTNERIIEVTPPGAFAPIIGHVWTFRLRLGFEAYVG